MDLDPTFDAYARLPRTPRETPSTLENDSFRWTVTETSPAERANVAILLFDGVEVLDFAGPYEVFSRSRLVPGTESRRSDDSAPFRVFTVSRDGATVVATGGLRVEPDHAFANAPHVDLLVVPGGFGTRPLLEDPEHLDWIRRVAADAEQVASVCTGALLLAKGGLLGGRRATTHWGALELLAEMDPTIEVVRDTRFVADGIITSAGVAAGIDMALSVVATRCGSEVAAETAHYMEYPWTTRAAARPDR